VLKHSKRAVLGMAAVLAAPLLAGCSCFKKGGELNPFHFRYLIPDGYSGWVQIQYEVPNPPPVPEENGCDLVRVPANGVFQTSDEDPSGCWTSEYFYVSRTRRRPLEATRSGGGGMIWGQHVAAPEFVTHPEMGGTGSFVGTEAEYTEDEFLRDRPSKTAIEFYAFGRLCGKEDGSRGFDEFSERTNTPPRREMVGGGKTQTYLGNLAGGIPGARVARQQRKTNHKMAEAYRLHNLLAAAGAHSGNQNEYLVGFKTGYGIEQRVIRARGDGSP
jgi:hypothetical protein